MTDVVIRPSAGPEEREARVDIVRSAWLEAYRHIFSEQEIRDVFDGVITMRGDWTDRRVGAYGNLLALIADEPAGVISLGTLREGDGEIGSLYVRPEHQGNGVGLALWESGLALLRDKGHRRAEVWCLERAAVNRFYRNRGCRLFARGVFRLGESHAEPTIGYEIDLTERAAPR